MHKPWILTSCTYDGLRYDLPPIIQAAHAKGIKVIIDEAWYGFARFHPAFRPTALEAGADYATQRLIRFYLPSRNPAWLQVSM
jgi:arginine decarboxylase